MNRHSLELSELHVEGKDDQHSILHLLCRHGIKPQDYACVKDAEGDTQLLENMAPAVKVSTARAVGFVLDAGKPIANRWEQVKHRLKEVNITCPDSPPPNGYVIDCPEYLARVGVWLMPDNLNDGALEDFLQALIAHDDKLIGLAKSSTDQAMTLGVDFADPDKDKAVLHCWLAWQAEPGCPYGTAMKATFFECDSPAALAFVEWFRELFDPKTINTNSVA